jgi:hypothetical protein
LIALAKEENVVKPHPALSKGEGSKKKSEVKVLSFGLQCVHIFLIIKEERPSFINVIEFNQALL